MKNFNILNSKYKTLTNNHLSLITGGGQADYNFGHGIGYGIRKFNSGISYWYHKHF